MKQQIQKVWKAIAATGATVAATGTTIFATVPEGVELPWQAWLFLGIFNAGIGFAVVFFAPKNAETKA